ncbi:MAG: hypothetical protein ACI8XC_000359, partial [Gammaproteobacteria bacterium]
NAKPPVNKGMATFHRLLNILTQFNFHTGKV